MPAPPRNGRYSLRLDPWAAEYDAQIQLPGSDEALPEVDLTMESRSWHAVRPDAAPRPDRVWFVDGVRRIEHRLLVEAEGQTLYGLLGSFAVGAAEVGAAARIEHAAVGRIVCIGGGLAGQPFAAPLPGNGCALRFDAETVAENSPVAPLHGLQNAMRRREARLAEELAAEDQLTFLDGPLSFLSRPDAAVVGFVKRLVRPYLEPEPFALVSRLEVGERTPVFLIRHSREPRFSWYARIAAGRVIDASLAGIARLETSGALPLGQVVKLADVSARLLPQLASDPARDPRAPQNLVPIGALERELRRRMGDAQLVRRAIEAQLHREVRA